MAALAGGQVAHGQDDDTGFFAEAGQQRPPIGLALPMGARTPPLCLLAAAAVLLHAAVILVLGATASPLRDADCDQGLLQGEAKRPPRAAWGLRVGGAIIDEGWPAPAAKQ